MYVDEIIKRAIEKDSVKWVAQAVADIETNQAYKAWCLAPIGEGPMTAEDREMVKVGKKLNRESGDAMRRHYFEVATHCVEALTYAIVEHALDEFNWEGQAENFLARALEQMTPAVAA